jgi:multidrug efflux pump subunit AcrB
VGFLTWEEAGIAAAVLVILVVVLFLRDRR